MQFHPIRLLLGVMLALSFPHTALSQLSLRVTGPDRVTVSNSFSYSINVTNRGTGIGQVSVSSSFPRSLQFIGATSNENVAVTVSEGSVNFLIQQVFPSTNVPLTLTLRPTQLGSVTNRLVLSLGNVLDSTNVVTAVTETPGNADVALVLTPPPSDPPIFLNDWTTLRVGLFNRGGGTVSGIFVTNRFTNAIVRDYRPTGGGTIGANGTRLVLNVGSLAAGQSTNFQITFQPTRTTNVGVSSNFRSSGNADTNSANNVASTHVTVQPSGPTNHLQAGIASGQVFNPQNALMEQRIAVTNLGTNIAFNARVIISNVTYRVVNAVGTNNGRPFVLHAAPIQPGERVELLLEYFIPDREPKANPKLITYSTTEVAPAAKANGSFTNFTHVIWREPFGSMTETNLLLIFRSEPGALYELQYSSNIEFTNALRALPLLVAPANSTVFIDYGPPKTISRPRREITIATNRVAVMDGTNVVGFTNVFVTNQMRFYRAMKLP
jgi:hypothetical protein